MRARRDCDGDDEAMWLRLPHNDAEFSSGMQQQQQQQLTWMYRLARQVGVRPLWSRSARRAQTLSMPLLYK